MSKYNIRFYCDGRRLDIRQEYCPNPPQLFDVMWLRGSAYLVDQTTEYTTGDVDVMVVPYNVYDDELSASSQAPVIVKIDPQIALLRSELSFAHCCTCFFLLTSVILSMVLLCTI